MKFRWLAFFFLLFSFEAHAQSAESESFVFLSSYFAELTQIAEKQRDDCDAMADRLRERIAESAKNASVVYSDVVLTDEEKNKISDAAKKFAVTAASYCGDHDGVKKIFESKSAVEDLL